MNYDLISSAYDRERMRAAVRYALRIADESPFKDYIIEQVNPVDADLVDDAALESPPNFESRRMLSMILAPLSNSNVREQKTNQNRERVRA